MMNINLAWDYPDLEARAALKEFRVYPVKPGTLESIGTPLVTTTIPTDAAPFVVPANSYIETQYAVYPVDLNGNEGTPETIAIAQANPLPKVTNLRVVG